MHLYCFWQQQSGDQIRRCALISKQSFKELSEWAWSASDGVLGQGGSGSTLPALHTALILFSAEYSCQPRVKHSATVTEANVGGKESEKKTQRIRTLIHVMTTRDMEIEWRWAAEMRWRPWKRQQPSLYLLTVWNRENECWSERMQKVETCVQGFFTYIEVWHKSQQGVHWMCFQNFRLILSLSEKKSHLVTIQKNMTDVIESFTLCRSYIPAGCFKDGHFWFSLTRPHLNLKHRLLSETVCNCTGLMLCSGYSRVCVIMNSCKSQI